MIRGDPMIPLHPLCELFPAIEGAAFDDLVTSIKEDGQREPIVLFDDQILDGRNRYRACLEAHVEPRFTSYVGTDPVRFVLATNVHRRHLNESQRAMIAAKLANNKVGRPQSVSENTAIAAISQASAAEMLNVSRDSISRARQVLERGEPEEVRAIVEGNATVSGIAKKVRERNSKKRLRSGRPTQTKESETMDRTGKMNAPPPPRRGPYRAIVVSASHLTEEMRELPVAAISAPDCVLWLWIPDFEVRIALRLIDAWGFSEKGIVTWVKGNGRGSPGATEHCIIATKGNAPLKKCPTVLEGKVKHSAAKPLAFYMLVEKVTPASRYAEFFSQSPIRPTWDVHGEMPAAEAAE
jgi:N6-adenosine-specific RNA methylase IME4